MAMQPENAHGQTARVERARLKDPKSKEAGISFDNLKPIKPPRNYGSLRSCINYGGGSVTISSVKDLSKNLGGERGGRRRRRRRAFIMSCCAAWSSAVAFLVACIISHGSFACEWGGAGQGALTEQGFIHSKY